MFIKFLSQCLSDSKCSVDVTSYTTEKLAQQEEWLSALIACWITLGPSTSKPYLCPIKSAFLLKRDQSFEKLFHVIPTCSQG